MSGEEQDFFKPLWDHFDGELFRDLICDLLAAEGYLVEPSGVGPDGGIDAFAQEQIRFGYNNPEPFVWAVQCKFSSNVKKTISPSEVGPIFHIVNDERFKSKRISGYFLATNVRLSTNMMSELRGLQNAIPGFKTTYWDKSRIHDVLNKQLNVYKKYFYPSKPASPKLQTKITLEEIKEFEKLINSPNTREVEMLAFLEEHPLFLTNSISNDAKIFSQILLGSSEESRLRLRPDFFLNPGGNERWIIVELKRPSFKVVHEKGGKFWFSSTVFEAVAQLRQYKDYFESPWHRETIKNMSGIDVYKPRLMVIIGNDYGGLAKEEIIELKASLPDVEILTYSEILQRIKNLSK